MISNRDKITETLEKLLLIAKAKKDPWTFIEKFVFTKDEHDKENPEKRFPSECRKDRPNYRYLRLITRLFQRYDKILIEKSRQVLMSWLFCALALWYALRYKGSFVIIQKTKEETAIRLLERIKFIYDRLPKEMQSRDARSVETILEFKDLGSKIMAVSQDSEAVAGDTVSLLIADEMSKQPHGAQAYFSSRPTVAGGGKYIGICTPSFLDGGFANLLIHDMEDQWESA